MILVTGASGFVGWHVASRLAQAGHRVAGTFLSRPCEVPRADMVPVDLSDAGAARRLVRDMRPGAIVHCAAMTRQADCERHPADAEAAIVAATGNLAAAAAEFAPEAPFVAMSTDLVFGGDAAPYGEDDGAKPLGMYASLKHRAEAPVRALARGMVLRLALVYGPPAPGGSSFLGWMLGAGSRGEELTLFSDEWRTPVFVGDAVEAAALLLEKGAAGVYHAGGPDRLSRAEMGRMAAAAFGVPLAIREADRASCGAAGRAADVSLLCPRLLAMGWKQTPFAEGLIRCRDSWNSDFFRSSSAR